MGVRSPGLSSCALTRHALTYRPRSSKRAAVVEHPADLGHMVRVPEAVRPRQRELRGMNITPHVAQNDTNRRSAVDQRTTRHAGYEISQRKRKRVEQSFGWMKMVGMLKKVKLRGIDKVGWLFTFTGAAYNLCRLRNLMART